MALTSKFVATDENGNVDSAFAVQLLEHLLQHTLAKDKAVRMRTCQLVGAILSSMGANLDVDDDLSVPKRFVKALFLGCVCLRSFVKSLFLSLRFCRPNFVEATMSYFTKLCLKTP